ncbi:MAG: hypothetical protein HC869_14085 [Rhodospirillales bacterium]|nr:hypothetical protein [Rhodospirillales bacterium]
MGVRPTPRALEMAGHVQTALAQVNAAIAPKEIDITTIDRTIVLDIGGGYDALIMPRLMEEVTKCAPGLRLLVSNTRGADLLNELKYGETELALDFQPSNAEGIRCDLLSRDGAVVVARHSHPALNSGLTKDLYLKLPHAKLVWNRSSTASAVVFELDRLGLKPPVVASLPTFTALGGVVASSNLIATVPAIVARILQSWFRLEQYPLPFRLPPLALYQLWHARLDDNAGHRWLRQTIKNICAGPAEAKPLKWIAR